MWLIVVDGLGRSLLQKLTATAKQPIVMFNRKPQRSVKRNPCSSIMKRGTMAPSTAPTTLDRYRKLNERSPSLRSSERMAAIASGIVAPIRAHQGTAVKETQTAEAM